jgi:RNA polymerase sigma-70 factor (ECF subfamily)
VKAGSDAAWQRFLTLYRPLVLYWCGRAGLQAADAEDVAQEVFGAAAGAIEKFRHENAGDSLRGWLRTITQNKVRDHARRAARQVSAVGGSDAQRELLAVPELLSDPDKEVALEDGLLLRQAFEMILAGFKDHTRRAFWSVVIDGRSPDDVARELGIQVHSVYLAKSRVLRRLQDEFGELVGRNWGAEPGFETGPGVTG